MKIHFIAIGGSAMHNLAIALSLNGHNVTGSDDEIFDPAKSRLEKYGLLPSSIGWEVERITPEIDAIVLGMHARIDNPELLKAKELGIKIYSYPEFLYESSKEKKRVVVGGSHGKTTITAMILHVLNYHNMACDYMVGAQLEGFEVMVKLTNDAPIMVIEGDEYLTSPIDRRPKFHLYQPHVGIISGIAWDHINVFPTFNNYVEQFRIFADMIPQDGTYIYCKDDEVLQELSDNIFNTNKVGYTVHPYVIDNGVTSLLVDGKKYPLHIFGKHNLSNINAAKHACMAVGLTAQQFYEAITTFKGANNRLQLLKRDDTFVAYKDFAHSPSKLTATVDALREQYPNRILLACLELHTFSSLTEEFLQQYKGSMNKADIAYVYYSEKAVAHKKLPPISAEMVKSSFGNEKVQVFCDSHLLEQHIKAVGKENVVLALMSSGNFGGININELL